MCLLSRFIQLQAVAAGFFPAGAAVFAAAASVSKNRCEVNAEAAKSAAEQIAFPEKALLESEGPNDNYGVLFPLKGIVELIGLSFISVYSSGNALFATFLVAFSSTRPFPSNH